MPVHDDPAGPRPERAREGAGPSAAGRRSPVAQGAAHSVAEVLAPRGLETEDESGPRPIGGTPSEGGGAAASNDAMIGTTIAGRYRIEARLGEGGMGSVYRVEHTHMRKKLALKVLHREMTSQPEIVARFEREAMAAAHIEHPNVAGATDFGKLEDGSCYLVLEYVEGTSLRSQIDKGPLDAPRAINVTVQILSALKRAHELGIVHRDLKPENVLLVEKDGDTDFVKVLDFGIARVPIGAIGGEAGPSLTRAGMVYGTPEYMAPEQALGQEVDGRSDLYAVGVMLFEMLTGKRPYDNKDKVALLGQHVAGPIPSVRERAPADTGVTSQLDAVVTKMLAKSPSDRFQDAAEAAEALFMVGVDPSKPPPGFGDASGAYPTAGSLGTGSVPAISARANASPFEVAPTLPPPKMQAASPLAALVARVPPKIFALVGFGAVMLLVLAVVVTVRKPATGTGSDVDPKGDTKGSTATTATPSVDSKAKVQEALGRITSGEVEAGVKDLEALAKDFPKDPLVLKALAQGYAKAKRPVDALSSVKELLAVQPEASSDPVLDAVFDEALATPGAVDTAMLLLRGPMKGDGGRILYAIAYEGRGPASLSKQAKEALADPDVHKALPASIKGVLAFRSAGPTCAAKKDVLEKYKDDFDATVLPLLRPYQRTTGCGGFFKRSDCWPCLRDEKLLDKVISGIEERSKKQ